MAPREMTSNPDRIGRHLIQISQTTSRNENIPLVPSSPSGYRPASTGITRISTTWPTAFAIRRSMASEWPL